MGILFVACNKTIDNPTEPSSITTSQPPTITSNSNGEIPEYIPGSIKLFPDLAIINERGYLPKHREIWHQIPGGDLNMYMEKDKGFDFDKYVQSLILPDGELSEMACVLLVKHYNIPKEDFEKAIEKLRKHAIEDGWDLTHEEFELPNADIIYTFDNDLISEYYRRE